MTAVAKTDIIHIWNTLLSAMRYELQRLETVGLRLGYHPNHYVRYTAVCDAILRCAPHRTLLVLGCGPGLLEYILPGGIDCTSIDLNESALALARDINRHKPRRCFLQGDIYQLPCIVGERRFDVVCISEVLEHLPDDAAVLRLAASALAPRGHLVLTVPNGKRLENRVLGWLGREPILMAPGHLREYSLASARQLLREGGFRPRRRRGVYFSFPRPYVAERFISPYSLAHSALASMFPSVATYLLFTAHPATGN